MSSGRILPTIVITIFVLGLGLLFWNYAAPESLARTYGRFFGPPLEVKALEMDYGRQSVSLTPGQEFEINPTVPIRLTKLSTNRWRNYDLRLYSPNFDLEAITAKALSISDIVGDDFFLEPKDLLIEVLDDSVPKATFVLKGTFNSADWSLLGDTTVETEKKIVYYRKSLDLEPDSEPLFEKLASALLEANKKVELTELYESKLAKDPNGPQADEILNQLLVLYQDQKDKAKEISVLERLLPIAAAAGHPLEALKTNLAALYRSDQPLKAAEIYEELLPEAQLDHKRAYLNALINIYREEGDEKLEIAAWEKYLTVANPEETRAIWTELLGFKEKVNDLPGQREAWEGLADSLPDGLDKANAYKRLGYLWYLDKDLEQAEKAYEKALAHDQADPSLYLNLARLALANKARDRYLGYLLKAWELDKDPALTRELAQAYTQDGLQDKAAALWLALAETPGDDPQTLNTQTEAKARLLEILRPKKGSFSPEFEKRLYQFSDEKIEFYNLGITLFRAKKWDQALKAFQKAQSLDTENELINDIRGYVVAIYKEKGQIKEMLDEAMLLYKGDQKYKESRDLVVAHLQLDKNWETLAKAAGFWTNWHPEDPDNWRFLALAQRNSGQESQAAKSLLKVAELEPTKVAGWFTAAEALAKAGDKESAKLAYEKVLELEPTNDKAGTAILKLDLDSIPNKTVIQ
ncbi:MAG: tetratricopeptide repeat protein [Deltaproteobacteria bacterium]|jgi:tetratricopeptide (TPR) repeat protein|nr:tetratricopeptide repeat protein [Deltaproteobacteria bacterium]